MLVLASASPRRKEALAALGVPFRVVPSRVDERRGLGESPEGYASRLAREKAEEVSGRLADGAWVLGADTVVAVDDVVLGKPADRADARRMIAMLAGRSHRVATAWCVLRAGGPEESGLSVAEVAFRPLTDAEIDDYVATGEGDDKAGAYAIQGRGLWLVREMRGSLPAVVCLPVAEVLQALRELGAIG